MSTKRIGAAMVLALTGATVAQTNWIRRLPSPSPSARCNPAMAFDSLRGITVLFGGSASGIEFRDTWQYDGTTWTVRLHAPSPPSGSHMVFDSLRGVCVLITSGDTWEYDGVNWTLVNQGQNFGSYRIAFDASRSRTVVLADSATVSTPARTMEWDGASWTTFTNVVGPPQQGLLSNMAYDTGSQSCLIYSAFTGFPLALGWKWWQWDGTAWSSSAAGGTPYLIGEVLTSSAFGTILYGGTANGYTVLSTQWPQTPGGRSCHSMAYDSLRDRLILFGGYWLHPTFSNSQLRGDTWELARTPLAASSEPYGTGCGSPPLTLAPQAGSRPFFGTTHVLDVGNATPGATVMSWGHSNQIVFGITELPLMLDPWRMNGCPLWTSAESIGNACQTTGTQTTFDLAIPANFALLGAQLSLQAYSFQSGANLLQIVVSNGVQVTVGDA